MTYGCRTYGFRPTLLYYNFDICNSPFYRCEVKLADIWPPLLEVVVTRVELRENRESKYKSIGEGRWKKKTFSDLNKNTFSGKNLFDDAFPAVVRAWSVLPYPYPLLLHYQGQIRVSLLRSTTTVSIKE
jgi:hypothetical protein